MISQRDITAFFTIIDVLADPEKAKRELQMLVDLRASVDKDLAGLKEREQKAMNALADAQNIQRKCDSHNAELEDVGKRLDERTAALLMAEGKIKQAQEQQKSIVSTIKARELKLSQNEAKFTERETSLEDKEALYAAREIALRKKESEFAQKMSKLRDVVS